MAMFNLFGKKKEEAPKTPTAQELQVQEFAQRFQAEEMTLVAVTGSSYFSGARKEDESLWTMTMELTAWMDEYDGVVYQEPARLMVLANDELFPYLRQITPKDFIIKCKVRQGRDEPVFQLIGMPEPGFDPELKAILDEQIKPVTLEDEQFGTFTYDRSVNWFETGADWLGDQMSLTMDQVDEQDQCLYTARVLFEKMQEWDDCMRAYAADRLLEQVNAPAQEGEEVEELTREQFMEGLAAESVMVNADGTFEFWYSDGEGLLWGRNVHISGSVYQGLTDAQLEG